MANTVGMHSLRLLIELRDLCEDNGIRFVLGNHSAWDAVKFNRYHGDMYETAILIERDQFEALQGIELPANRSIREFTKRGCSAKYVDERSVLLDYPDNPKGALPMVGIEITIADRAADGFAIKKPDGSAAKLPPDSFDSIGSGEIEGEPFPIFSDMDPYLTALAGKSWRSCSYPYKVRRQDVSVVHIEDIDNDLFMSQPVVRESLSADWKALRDKYWSWQKKEYNPALKHYADHQKYLDRTDDRFRLWERYYPMKGEILELAQADPHGEELRGKLAELLECMWSYKKKGLGFTIDEGLLQACIPLLVDDHGQSEVDGFLAMIPKAYREQDIDELLRARGVQHPLLG